MPAALLVLLAALAGVFGVPATASDGPGATRSVLHAPAPARLVAPSRLTPAVRAGTTAAVRGVADRGTEVTGAAGPVPTAAVRAAWLLLALAVLGRVVVGRGGWPLPRRTPGSRRGRAPPAQALAPA